MISGPPTPPPGVPGNSGKPENPDNPAGGPAQAKRKRDPLPLIVAGVLAAVLIAIFCLGGALLLFDRRTRPDPQPSPVPTLPAPSGQPMPSPGP